jgi:hypothetical protein
MPIALALAWAQDRLLSSRDMVSPDLAAGIRRVKGARTLGVRLGNWLTAEQARMMCQAPSPDSLKGNETELCWRSYWAAACAVGRPPSLTWLGFNDGKTIGQSWTWSGGIGIFARSRCLIGIRHQLIRGSAPLE